MGWEEIGDHPGVGDRQAVDDSSAGQRRQMLDQPSQSGGGGRNIEHGQVQPRSIEGPALGDECRAELGADVGDDAVVGRCRAAEDRDLGGQAVDEGAQPPVVGAKIVPPVRDAMHLVDDQQPRILQQHREPAGDELLVGEAFGGHQQQIDLVAVELVPQTIVVVGVGRVDRLGPQPEALGGLQLVAHQGEQRRHDDRRPQSGVAQDPRRQEVHRALAPTGSLHQHDPFASDGERFDRLALSRSERRIGAAGQHP